jgi:hypothetical protein
MKTFDLNMSCESPTAHDTTADFFLTGALVSQNTTITRLKEMDYVHRSLALSTTRRVPVRLADIRQQYLPNYR